MVNDTEFRKILHSHPAYILRGFIAQHNISGYSKMKKAEIVDIMMYYKNRFKHIKRYVKPKKARAPRAPRKPRAPPRPPRPDVIGLANLGLGLARR